MSQLSLMVSLMRFLGQAIDQKASATSVSYDVVPSGHVWYLVAWKLMAV